MKANAANKRRPDTDVPDADSARRTPPGLETSAAYHPLLIVLNTLIYFAYQGNDPAREEQAVSTYLNAGLLSREKTAFIQSFSAEHELDADQQKALARERQRDRKSVV